MMRAESKRLLSLDVFRGITIAGMILVNSPGNDTAYAPLDHAAWNGLTPTDLVFPFFVFIVGVSLVFSLSRRLERGEDRSALMAQVLKRYPNTDDSLESRYARSIAYAQPGQADLKKSIALADSLIAEFPNDPYFQENKAEILLKSANQAKAALPYYETSAAALPDSPMILLELAMAQLSIGDPPLVKKAIPELERVVRIEPKNGSAWHQLCIAYGTDGQLAMASLACAEEASNRSSKRACRQAKEQADRAMHGQNLLDELCGDGRCVAWCVT